MGGNWAVSDVAGHRSDIPQRNGSTLLDPVAPRSDEAPEPASAVLFALGMVGVAAWRRRTSRASASALRRGRPATMCALGLLLAGLGGYRRRRRKRP